MRRATAGTTRSVRTNAAHLRPVSKTKGRAHPTRRRQGASENISPTRSPHEARAECARRRSDGARDERAKGCVGRSSVKRESRGTVRVAGCAARVARVRGDEGAVGSLPSARQRGDAHREAERSAQRLGRKPTERRHGTSFDREGRATQRGPRIQGRSQRTIECTSTTSPRATVNGARVVNGSSTGSGASQRSHRPRPTPRDTRGTSVTAAPGRDRKDPPGVRVSPGPLSLQSPSAPSSLALVSPRRGCASTTRDGRSPCRRGRA